MTISLNKYLNLYVITALVLVPITGIYEVLPGVSLDRILLLCGVVLYSVSNKKLPIEYTYVYFFSGLIVISFLSYLTQSHQDFLLFRNNTLSVVLTAFLLAVFVKYSERVPGRYNITFIDVALFFGTVATVIIIYQFISFWIFREVTTFYLPITENIIEHENISSNFRGRPTSLFLEPAHYAIFILPLYYYSLRAKKKLFLVIFTTGLILSTSTTGIASVILMLLYVLFFSTGSKFQKGLVLLFLISLITTVGLLFQENRVLFTAIEKLSFDNLSQNKRLVGNIELLDVFSLDEWVFGIGLNQIETYAVHSGLQTVGNYSSSFFMMLYSYGILGFSLFVWLLSHIYKVNSDKGYFIIFTIILLTDQIIFNRHFFFLIICIYAIRNRLK